MEALEVFALTSDMQRATGSIPYTSLMWDRKYYEPGSFLMELPANVYDPSWAYIYTDERPETGIIQKVEYSDTATTAGGVDTVILSGFFLEHELNRYTFLVEETEEEAYRIYKPAPAKTVKPTLWQAEGGQTYVKYESLGSPTRWETLEGDYVDPAKLDTTGLTEIELGAGEGLKQIWYDTNNTDRFPDGKWTANQYTNGNYSYYSEDGQTLHSVAPDGTEKTFDIVRGGTGDVIYEDSDGSLKWVNGVASSLGETYVRARDSWEKMVKTEGLEVVTGDGTIMGGSTYARAYRTVKGPWQLRTDLDVNEPADNVQRIIQWAQDIWGNNILYDEVGFAGEEKIIDPSLKLFGDLAYEELKTIGASPRLFYSFESDTCVFQVWRGLDRTQSQAGLPEPDDPVEPEPDEPSIDDLYEAVDYIEADGTQWIDTGFVPNQDTRVLMRAYFPLPAAGTAFLLGARTSASSNVFSFMGGSSYYRTYYDNGYTNFGSDVVFSAPFTIDMNKNVTTLDGSHVATRTYGSFTCPCNLTLFALNTTAGTAETKATARVYYCQIYDNDTLIRDYVPMRRKADGVFGLLDLVSEVFYESASGVPFTGPSYAAGTYEELDYIVSTGEQYIDTGFKHNQNTRVVMHVQQTTSPTAYVWAFEGRDSNTVGANGVLWFYSENLWKSDYAGNSDRQSFTSIGANDHLYIDKNKNAVTINGETVTHTAKAFQSSTNLVLMACNTGGAISGHLTGRLYYTQIYDNGTIARDYVPRRRVSDGTVGLLDLVHGTFYESAGSEPFLAPGELPAGYTRLEYIESTGSQYIDTGFNPSNLTRVVCDHQIIGSGSGNQSVFGAWDGAIDNAFMYLANADMTQAYVYFDTEETAISASCSGRHIVDANQGAYYLDGTLLHECADATFECGYPLFVCAWNWAGAAKNITPVRVYSQQICENGTLARDYVPAKNSGVEAGLFDLVTMTFYADAAGVGFVSGPELAAVATVEEASTFALTRTVAASDESNTAANPFAVFSDTWGTLYGFTASKDVSNYRNTCYVLYQFRDQTDADGNPIGPRGFVKARLEDELPDAETYLDLRGEEPEEGQTDEAFVESLRQRGLAHLQTNYAAIESLDTGTLAGNGYLDGYDLGDKVDMLVEAIGLVKEARITGVCEVHEAGSSTATLEIGEQKLTNIRKAVIV